ncbi:hypothetical protein B0H19DRAFT_1263574 [Mycena capillaripes]|nr:hypothetical protein B0H19DRAFT_1263574 [Mycena capillaripes]
MTPFARERIKKAHNGRETRGVLVESTSHSVGTSMLSTITFFVNCVLIFFAPALAYLLVFALTSYRSSVAYTITITRYSLSELHPAALGSIYVYWTMFCVYLREYLRLSPHL